VLLGRTSEGRLRLLADLRIILPDEPGKADWLNYIAEYLRVNYGYVKVYVGQSAGELYRCTFGINRLVILVLNLAYVEFWQRGPALREPDRYWYRKTSRTC
jgi:hypothetical protein